MHNVLHVPNLHSNLLSVTKLILRGSKVHFNSLVCVVRASNIDMLAMALLESNLNQFNTDMMNGAKTSSLVHYNVNTNFWSFGTRNWGISTPIA